MDAKDSSTVKIYLLQGNIKLNVHIRISLCILQFERTVQKERKKYYEKYP